MRIVLLYLYSKICIFFGSKSLKLYPHWLRSWNSLILGPNREAQIFDVIRTTRVKILSNRIEKLSRRHNETSRKLLSHSMLSEEEKNSIEKRISLMKAIDVSFKNNPKGDPYLINALKEEHKKAEDRLNSE